MFCLEDGAKSVGGGKLGEPLVDVFFDDVVENENSALVGCEVLPEDGNTNGGVSGAYVSEYVIKVIALV